MPRQLPGRVNTHLLDETWTNFRAQKCILRLWEPIWHLQVTSRSFGEVHSFFFADPFGCWPPCLQERRFHENFNAVKDRVEHELLLVKENIPNRDLKRLVMCFQLLRSLSCTISHIVLLHSYFMLVTHYFSFAQIKLSLSYIQSLE